MTLTTIPWLTEALTKIVSPTTLNSKILILATQVHTPQKSLPQSGGAVPVSLLFMVSGKKRRQGSKHSEIIALFHYCSTTKFIPLKVDLELCVLLVLNKKGNEEKACTFGDLESY